MTCSELRVRLDDYVDGELGAAEARAVEAHLEACPACREERRRLQGLLALAAALPREQEPGRDLWPGVEARIRGRGRVLAFVSRSARTALGSQRLGLLAAAAVLVAVSSAVTAFLVRPVPVDRGADDAPATLSVAAGAEPLLRAERDYERAAAELIATLEDRRDLLDPETRESIEQNLKVIDEALGALRQALEKDPGNRALARLYNTTQRRRVDVLQGAVRLSQL